MAEERVLHSDQFEQVLAKPFPAKLGFGNYG